MLRVGDELITLIDPDAPASEAYRTLRTNILMRNFDRDMKVINIISTTAQEGKTTRVLNLAMVYAQLQKKVLVIDLDLRMPTIHKKLKLKNKKGISDIIGHQAEFEEVVLQPYENVDVITAGTKPPSGSSEKNLWIWWMISGKSTRGCLTRLLMRELLMLNEGHR